MSKRRVKQAALLGGLTLAVCSVAPAMAQNKAEEIIQSNCLGCHQETGDPAHPWSRISMLRKTPEGWALTLRRMREIRGAPLSPEDEAVLIKYLADNQGLAPEETKDYRYILERQPNIVETDVDPELQPMCARCHSAARFSLQRRPASEWEKLVHFHVGQFPTIELQAMARDRPWFQIATQQVVPRLGEMFPLETEAWKNWTQASKPVLEGSWRVAGYLPEKGDYDGRLTARKTAEDRYDLTLTGTYRNGRKFEGKGQANVFTGYEWRADIDLGEIKVRQVMAADQTGSTLTGRMFLLNNDEFGGDLKAVKEDSQPHVVAVFPSYLKAGTATDITIVGSALSGDVSLGNGIKIGRVVSRSADQVVVRATAPAGAAAGVQSVKVGSAVATDAFAVYQRLARVEVTPGNSVSRVGGNGSPIPKVEATYRAVGFDAGKDGVPGNQDDVRIGFMPATWSIEPFDEVAAEDNDVKYAGVMDARTGMFTPGDAGPNPERKMSANNVGNLKVVGTVKDGDATASGEGRLVVAAPLLIALPLQ